MPTLQISDDVLRQFPAARTAFAVATNARNLPGAGSRDLDAEIATVCERLTEAIVDHPHVQAWRETYQAFGAKPSRTRPSMEALARRVAKTGQFPRINPIVDAYNLASVEHLLPAGAFDLSKIDDEITLRVSPGGEKFVGIGDEFPSETFAGEVVYADRSRVLTRSWNYRDADQAKVTTDATDVVLLTEAAHPGISDSALRACQERIAELVRSVSGADMSLGWLDRASPRAVIG